MADALVDFMEKNNLPIPTEEPRAAPMLEMKGLLGREEAAK
jgi:hypothetical protein